MTKRLPPPPTQPRRPERIFAPPPVAPMRPMPGGIVQSKPVVKPAAPSAHRSGFPAPPPTAQMKPLAGAIKKPPTAFIAPGRTAPAIQKMEQKLLDVDDQPRSYGLAIGSNSATFTFTKAGPPTPPTKPKYDGGEVPKLHKDAGDTARQVVKLTVGDGISIDGTYSAYRENGEVIFSNRIYVTAEYRSYTKVTGFWCCKRRVRTPVAMVHYMAADPPQQGIGALMVYVFAGKLEQDGVRMVASGTHTPAADGLIRAMGAQRTSAPGGYVESVEEGAVTFFTADPGASKRSAEVKFRQSGWTRSA